MTPEDQDELRALHAELEEDAHEQDARLHRLLDLVAWAIRQRRESRPLHIEENWPIEDVFSDPLLRWISRRDPDFFDLARFQLAHAMKTRPLASWAGSVTFAASLLADSPPNRRGLLGENPGRDALIMALARQMGTASVIWASMPKPTEDGIGPRWSDHALANKIADLLAWHELLQDDGYAPTADAVRPILGKMDKWRERHGLGWDILDGLICPCIGFGTTL